MSFVGKPCSKCGKVFEPKEPYIPEGAGAVHQGCFSLGNCGGCGGDLFPTEDIAQALDKKWHVKCFVCSQCRQPIQGSFAAREGKPVCKDCAKQPAAGGPPRGNCVGCSQPVTAGQPGLEVPGAGFFHRDCFVCSRCRNSLLGGAVVIDSKFFCDGCKTEAANEMRQRQAGGDASRSGPSPAASSSAPPASSAPSAAQAPAQAPAPAQTTTKFCVGCKATFKPGDQIVKLNENLFHKDCVKCGGCNQPIQGGQYAQVNDLPHCIPCCENIQREERLRNERARLEHEKRQQLQDAAAQMSISSSSAPSSSVRCCICSQNLSGGYNEFGGKAYCDDCALVVQKSTSCEKCKKTIDPNIKFRKALGKFWHLPCFCCTECKQPIQEDNFKAQKGKPYCDEHFTLLFGQIRQKCPLCQKVINDGEAIEHSGVFYHSHCFVCFGCRGPFINGQFMPNSRGNLFCRTCFLNGSCV